MRAVTNKKELSRFIVGGCSAVITDYLTYLLMVKMGIDVAAAKLISFMLGSLVGFIINKYWTFESDGKVRRELMKYALLYAITAGLNVWVNQVALNNDCPTWLAFLFCHWRQYHCQFSGAKVFCISIKRGFHVRRIEETGI